MSTERWERTKQILEEALRLAPERRGIYLESACAHDSALRKEVESLMAAHEDAGSQFLGEAAPALLEITTGVAASRLGQPVGPYRIVEEIGRGGMGVVYKAEDTRLHRFVALKFLPEEVSRNPISLARFRREAEAASALNHPNICTVYDIGQQGGAEYLVMELLEGETLASRLGKGALPPDRVIEYGIEVADALDAAHRRRIVHRDLKPGNIFVTARGNCKVLDFGLAKLEEENTPDARTAAASRPEVLTSPGLAMGTVAYMSPEQARGEELDARTDIFSLGSVLYEMATGQLAFPGKTSAVVFDAILNGTPVSPTVVNPLTPPQLDGIVGKALEKERDLRYQSAADLRSDLKRLRRDTGSGKLDALGAAPGTPESGRVPGLARGTAKTGVPAGNGSISSSRKVFSALAVLTLVLAAIMVGRPHRTPTATALASELNLPDGAILDTLNDPVAISPDGRELALALLNGEGNSQLWLRRLDNGQMSSIPGTTAATYPFWSPDGRSIGFFVSGKLRRVDLSSNAVQNICDAPRGRGGTWNESGTIVFAPDAYGGLSSVPASGGTPTDLSIALSASDSLRMPRFLPDGNQVLYLRFPQNGPSHIETIALGSKQTRELLQADAAGQYVASGRLLFVRGNSLMVQNFDPERLSLSGEVSVLAAGVQVDPARRTATFSVSPAGLLVYAPGSDVSLKQLQWIDDVGKPAGNIGQPAGYYYDVSLSPDDKLVAVGAQKYEISIIDMATAMRRPFSSSTKEPIEQQFVWSPDAKWLAFTAETPENRWAIYRKAADGRTESRLVHVCQAEACLPTSWSNDEKLLAVEEHTVGNPDFTEIILSVESGKEAFRIPHCWGATFSPDGKWLAFLSDEGGKSQAFVTDLPPGREKWQVSSEGAFVLSWPTPGTLLYQTLDGKMMGVAVSGNGNEFHAGESVVRFGGRQWPADLNWSASHDAKRILAAVPTEAPSGHSLRLMQNWDASVQ